MGIRQVKACRKDHLDSLIEKQGIVQQLRDDAWLDLNEWRIMAQQELVSKCVETDDGSSAPEAGFQLEVHLEKDGYREEEGGVDDSANVSVDTSVERDFEEEEDDDDFDEAAGEDDEPATAISETSKHGEPLEGSEESNVQNFFKRSFSAPPNLRTKLDLRGKLRRGRLRSGSDHDDFETELFLTYFWPEMVDAKKVTTVVDSFPCSFRDGGQRIPFQYGRVYLTPTRIVFTSWSKKKLNLYWQEVSQVKPSRGFHGLRNDTVHVICRKKDSGDFSCMTLGGFYDRVTVLEKIEKLREDARIEAEKQAAAEALAQAKAATATAASSGQEEEMGDKTMIVDWSPDDIVVPPDEKISTMTIVVSKVIHGISVQTFYDVVWAETEKPLYRPWLEQSAFDIDLEDWKQGEVVGSWCKEKYQMSRRAKFKVKRTTHLYIGPPIANVVQMHRVRLEGNDKCVTSMTIEFEGIPYSDCFAVEVRYVATRQGNDVKYECGLFVDFRKSTFLKRQIQSGTIEESTPVYRNFFKVVHTACLEAQGGDAEAAAEAAEEEEEELAAVEKAESGFQAMVAELQKNSLVVGAVCFLIFSILLRRVFAAKTVPDSISESSTMHFEMDLMIARMDKLEDQMSRLQNTLDEIVSLLKERSES